MVIEGLLATGTQIERTARRARAAGASRVVAAAVLADEGALQAGDGSLDGAVVVLQKIQLAAD